jgi:NAD(P)H dehydrogenase (quinone)
MNAQAASENRGRPVAAERRREMRYLIIHAHPEPKSFNGALTRHAQRALTAAGHEVKVSDLYAMKFNPVFGRHNFTTVKDPEHFNPKVEETHAVDAGGLAPDIQAEVDRLEWCDVLVFQFPLWWFSVPAILKGWVDRVFVRRRVYDSGKWFDRGLLKGKKAMLSVTTGGDETMFGDRGIYGDLRDILFHVNHGMFAFTSFDVLPPFVAWSPARASDERRRQYLDEYAKRLLAVNETEPIKYPKLEDFDEKFQIKPGKTRHY